jgi:hypothetical protein
MTFDVRENERKMSVYAGVFGLFNFAAVVAEMKGAKPVVATPVCGNHDRDAARRLVPGHHQCRRAHVAGRRHPRRFEEPKRSEELYIAFEHVALTGGLLLAAVASR